MKYLLFVSILLVFISCEKSEKPNTNNCTNIDCSNHGECGFDNNKNAVCICDNGYHDNGLNCISDDNPCDGVSCNDNSSCIDGLCECDSGFQKQDNKCVLESDLCNNINCQENSSCTLGVCECDYGFELKDGKCITDGEECGDTYCSNNGSCKNSVCECNDGYSGVSCNSFFLEFGTRNWNVANTIVSDKDGNIYIGGFTEGNLAGTNLGDYDLFLAKYNSDGEQLWIKQWGTSSYEVLMVAIIDKDGNIFVTGETEGNIDHAGNKGEADVFLSKFSSAGERLWTKQFGSNGWDNPYGMVMDSKGFIYIAGETANKFEGESMLGNQDLFLIKVDSSTKKKVWAKVLGSNSVDSKGILTIDKDDNIYLSGSVNGSSEDDNITFDMILIKYNTLGDKLWEKIWAEDNLSSAVNDILLDSQGNIYIVGETQDSNFDGMPFLGESDIFITKFAYFGDKLWTKDYGTSQWNTAEALVIDDKDNLFVSGHVYGAFDGYTNQGEGDLFLMKLDNSGVQKWVKQLGTSDDDSSRDMIISNKDIYVTGYWNSGYIGDTQDGKSNIYIKKFSFDDLVE